MDLWIVPAWSLKNKEVFRIGLVDCPRVERKNKELFRIGPVDCPHMGGVQLVDCPRVEP